MSAVAYTTPDDLDVPFIASPLESEELGKIEGERQRQQGLIEGVEKVDSLNEIAGKFLVEVHMHHERSMNNPYVGIIHTMVQSKRFGGGGLMPMYSCADERCGGFIPPELYSPTTTDAACPKCQRIWHVGQVFAHRKYILPNQYWAQAIARTVLRLHMDADVKIIFFAKPLIKPTLEARESPRLGLDQVEASRREIRRVLYPLGRILKDLSTGAELVTALRAFITA